MNKIISTIVIFCFLFGGRASAQDEFLNTITIDSSTLSPPATLDEVAWIAGAWEGEAFGSKAEEVWSRPSGGSMMGMFKLFGEDDVVFYELLTIKEVGETLLLRIKHFDTKMRGWEEKDRSVEFRFVSASKDKVYFDGLTFERISAQEMNVYVVIENDNGTTREQKFPYSRRSL